MFKVDLNLNTVMWNEGFEKANYPWVRLYTDNVQWVKALPPFFQINLENEPFPQDFRVKIEQVSNTIALPDTEQAEWENLDNPYYENELEANQKRFHGILVGATNLDLDNILEQRISDWDGI
jgi:hypothetical protein